MPKQKRKEIRHHVIYGNMEVVTKVTYVCPGCGNEVVDQDAYVQGIDNHGDEYAEFLTEIHVHCPQCGDSISLHS